jgi:hypothetical protein
MVAHIDQIAAQAASAARQLAFSTYRHPLTTMTISPPSEPKTKLFEYLTKTLRNTGLNNVAKSLKLLSIM